MTTELLREHLTASYQADYFQRQVLKLVFGSALKVDAASQNIALSNSDAQVLKSLKRYGKINLNDGRELDLYEAILQPQVQPERAKIGIGMMVKKHIFGLNAALVCFVNPERTDSWRFSFIARGSKIEDGKRVDDDSNPQRYTYVFGPAESCRTAAERFQVLSLETDLSVDSFLNAFEVEKLSDGFFTEYKYTHYSRFIESISGWSVRRKGKKDEWEKNKNASTAFKTFFNADEKRVRDFVKKLLGRIVFLYFLQKKGWLGVPKGGEWGTGDKNFLQNLFNHCPDKENFYSNYLSKLFFETLNNPTQKQIVQEFLKGKPLLFPYLNGGLFEEDDNDPDWITFKPALFEDLFDFFNRYNFTVYEDSTDEHTVAVDPEMLGHIFENLLEDNKDKGAFYTPKEIVHYMCRESLIEYLNTRLNVFEVPLGYTGKGLQVLQPKSKPGQLAFTQTDERDNVRRDELEDFVKNKNANPFIHQNAEAIDKLLDTVKICDPAIGSGAFPMGLLHEIFQLKMVLHDFVFATSGKLFHYKNYSPTTYRSDVKLNIIENSIYGVDIEKGAVDIARLRFWLSLVVDENEPRALPNLDYKIVVGNSLLPKFGDEVIDLDWNLAERELLKVEQRKMKEAFARLIIMERNVFEGKGNKVKLQGEIRALKIELLLAQLEINRIKYTEREGKMQGKLFGSPSREEALKALEVKERLSTFAKVSSQLKALQKNKEPVHFFDWALDFPEVMNPLIADKTGFDIVIGNPPYGAAFSEEDKNSLFDVFPLIKGQPESYEYFLFNCTNLLLKKFGVLSFINPTNFIESKRSENLRNYFLTSGSIKVISNFRFNVWKDNAAETLIFIYKRDEKDMLTKILHPKSMEEFVEGEGITCLNQKDWLLTEGQRYIIRANTSLISKINNDSVQLNKVCEISQGIIVYKTREDSAKNLYISGEHKGKQWVKLLDGKSSLKKYGINWGGNYLKYGNWLWCSREQKYFNQPKILLIRLRNKSLPYKLIGAYDEDCYYNRDNFNNIISKDKNYSLKYVLALFNSELLNYWYRAHFDNVNINPEQLRQLPIKKFTKQQIFIAVVDKILAIKKTKVDADTTAHEKAIDLMVYKLYNLNWQEIITVEGNEQNLHAYTNRTGKTLSEKIYAGFKDVEDVVQWWEGK